MRAVHVAVDPEAADAWAAAISRVIDDGPEAARLAVPKYRAPWKFPKQYLAT